MSAQRISVRNLSGHTVTLDEGAGIMTIADDGGDLLTFDAKQRTLIVQINGGSMVINDGVITINNGTILIGDGKVTIAAPSGVAIDSSDIRLGSAAEPASLVKDNFIDFFNSHVHIDRYSMSTSTPVTQAEKQDHVTQKTRAE